MTQQQMILQHLQEKGPLTPIDALNKFGCFRLAAAVHALKCNGHTIVTELVKRKKGKAFARYHYGSKAV